HGGADRARPEAVGGDARALGARPAAVPAQPDDREVREPRRVAELAPNLLADRVQAIGGDRGDLRAALAVQVFNVVFAGQDVQARRVAEVQVPAHAAILEQLEVAIDR